MATTATTTIYQYPYPLGGDSLSNIATRIKELADRSEAVTTQIISGSITLAPGTIYNVAIAATAAISYSKLDLNNSILNADLFGGISPSKITGTAITAADTGTVTSTMLLDGTIVNADVNASAAIDKTKISGTAVTIADTGTVTGTMIANGVALGGNPTTTTQTQADNSTRLATTSYVDTAANNFVLGAIPDGSITNAKINSAYAGHTVVANTAARPSSPTAGQMIYQTDADEFLTWVTDVDGVNKWMVLEHIPNRNVLVNGAFNVWQRGDYFDPSGGYAYISTTTAATGAAGTATLTVGTHYFYVGQIVRIAGITPAGYNNAAATITGVTATTIRYANATTGPQTVAGTVRPDGSISYPNQNYGPDRWQMIQSTSNNIALQTQFTKISTLSNDTVNSIIASVGDNRWDVQMDTYTSNPSSGYGHNTGLVTFAGFTGGAEVYNGTYFCIVASNTNLRVVADSTGAAVVAPLTFNSSVTGTATYNNPSNYNYYTRMARDETETYTTPFTLQQTVDVINTKPLRSKFVTLSFWARCGAGYSATSKLLVSNILYNSLAGGNYQNPPVDINLKDFYSPTTLTTNHTLTPAWQRFSVTTPAVLPSTVSQIGVSFGFTPVGTNTTAGGYGMPGRYDTVDITGVQLEGSPVLSDYDYEHTATTLSKCKQYYQKYAAKWIPAANHSTTFARGSITFPEMRANPIVVFPKDSILLTSLNANAGTAAIVVSTADVTAQSAGFVATVPTATLVAGNSTLLQWAAATRPTELLAEL